MREITNLLFEARMLKNLPRSGYHFLGTGRETVAEHSFMTTFIAYVMSQMEKDIDSHRLIAMCLVHDLPEARTGDLNNVQKRYVSADTDRALADITGPLSWGSSLKELVEEFEAGKSPEAILARDADQLSFLLDLKAHADIGGRTPEKWMPYLLGRLQTDIGKRIAEEILQIGWDDWWLKNYVD